MSGPRPVSTAITENPTPALWGIFQHLIRRKTRKNQQTLAEMAPQCSRQQRGGTTVLTGTLSSVSSEEGQVGADRHWPRWSGHSLEGPSISCRHTMTPAQPWALRVSPQSLLLRGPRFQMRCADRTFWMPSEWIGLGTASGSYTETCTRHVVCTH